MSYMQSFWFYADKGWKFKNINLTWDEDHDEWLYENPVEAALEEIDNYISEMK